MDASIPAGPWLEHLVSQLPMAKAGDNPQAVHQVRIALERLRVWLFLGQRQELEPELKWLRDEVGQVRDLQIQLKEEPPDALAELLRARLAEAQARLAETLEQPRVQWLVDSLRTLPALESGAIKGRLRRLLREVKKRGRRAAGQHNPKRWHKLRQALRRLRFAVEWQGRRPDKLIALQDVLGAMNDHANTLHYLAQVAPSPELEERREDVERDLSRLRRKAERRWRRIRPRLRRKKLLAARRSPDAPAQG